MKQEKMKTEESTKHIEYWLHLSELYFEAETTEAEEEALMRFVASEESRSPDLGASAIETFDEVRSCMSLILEGKSGYSSENKTKESIKYDETVKVGKKGRNAWKWAASIAALVALTFIIRGINKSGGQDEVKDVCIANVYGKQITDKEEVLSLMRESWEDIDILSADETIETQMKDMFDVLE